MAFMEMNQDLYNKGTSGRNSGAGSLVSWPAMCFLKIASPGVEASAIRAQVKHLNSQPNKQKPIEQFSGYTADQVQWRMHKFISQRRGIRSGSESQELTALDQWNLNGTDRKQTTEVLEIYL